jgi:hypothetical protein
MADDPPTLIRMTITGSSITRPPIPTQPPHTHQLPASLTSTTTHPPHARPLPLRMAGTAWIKSGNFSNFFFGIYKEGNS